MLAKETNISMAVSMIDSHRDLLKLLDTYEAIYAIKINKEEYSRIWRDIKRVPKAYAL